MNASHIDKLEEIRHIVITIKHLTHYIVEERDKQIKNSLDWTRHVLLDLVEEELTKLTKEGMDNE